MRLKSLQNSGVVEVGSQERYGQKIAEQEDRNKAFKDKIAHLEQME